MAVFVARYSGSCAGGDYIEAGQMVRYVEDELVHVECAPEPAVERGPRPTCPDCFMELPLSGVCSCA